uniref:Exocyst complex component Sec8 n=1 Tax=Macrostomum lignano TaxID=282301 RepID=A0A1I8HT77_9PLAT
MTDILPSHSITGGVFSPLTLFESTITNAQMLVESMAERELFSALRIIGGLHSHVVQVMEPRYGRLCERSDHLAELEAAGLDQSHGSAAEAAEATSSSSAAAASSRRFAKEEKLLGDTDTEQQCTSLEPPEILEEDADDEDEDDDCVITDYFDDSSFGASGIGAFGGVGPSPAKMPRLGGVGGGAGDSSMPAECKTIMRRAYKALKGNGPHLFDFSLPFSSEHNQRVATRVTAKAKEMAQGKGWPEDIWLRLPKESRVNRIHCTYGARLRAKHRQIGCHTPAGRPPYSTILERKCAPGFGWMLVIIALGVSMGLCEFRFSAETFPDNGRVLQLCEPPVSVTPPTAACRSAAQGPPARHFWRL